MLPFTRDQFFAVFADYNTAVWPAQWLAYGVGLAVSAALLRRSAGSDRVVALGLALMWAWTGVAYHGLHFATINPAALLFALLFLLQALLLAHAALRGGRLRFGAEGTAARVLGWGLIGYAALAYPLIGLWTGHRYPAMPTFGITPCPVTLFTLGALLLARPPLPRRLLVVPLLWTVVGGSAALLLAVPQDIVLLASSVVAAGLLWRDRRPPRSAAV